MKIKDWEKEHPNWNLTEGGTTDYMEMIKNVMGGTTETEICKNKELIKFWKLFDRASKDEWFDSREEAERFFSGKKNFNNLIEQKYEKLNIQFSVIILRDYKIAFDKVLQQTMKNFNVIPHNIIDERSKIVFAEFPPLHSGNIKQKTKIDPLSNSEISQNDLPENEMRNRVIKILSKKNISISKIFNTQGVSIKNLRLRA